MLATAKRRYRRLKHRRRLAKSVVFKPELARYLPPDPIVVEAGAHRGIDTVSMAKQWPRGTIHAFEPVPSLYQELRDRTSAHANVKTYGLALSDRAGSATMHVSSGNDQSSSLRQPHQVLADMPGTTFSDTPVETTTLDAWAADQGIVGVDFMWLDMEGCELDGLRGGERLVESVSAVYTEVALNEQYEGEALYPQLRGWLEERGFRVEIEKLPWAAGGNVLFVR